MAGPGRAWTVIRVGSGLLLGLAAAVAANGQECVPVSGTERVSVASNGDQGNDRSEIPAVNQDGCIVGFKSFASNLVPGDLNAKVDVFVRDRGAGTTERIPNAGFTGAEPNDNSSPPTLDASGNTVAFGSLSNNLAPGDFNQKSDLFVYVRSSASIEILSLAQMGTGGGGVPDQPPSLSADGRYVVFSSTADELVSGDKNQASDVIFVDRTNPTPELVSLATAGSQPGTSGNGPSAGGVVTPDGCQVAFYSDASNIVPQDTNQRRDVFVRNRCAGTTDRVSLANDGSQANGDSQAGNALPAIDASGNLVVFSSDATNLDPGDDNNTTDIFVRDRVQQGTTRVSKNINGTSADGPSQYPSINADGTFVVFQSDATNLVDGDTNQHTDIFVVSLATGEVRRVSVSGAGDEGDGDSIAPRISADGTTIVFQSYATNLVPGDTNGAADIFIVSNPLSVASPTPTPTAGDSCGATCADGQGCRREVGSEIQDGECVVDKNCQCIVGGTETPTATVTVTPTVTVTATVAATVTMTGAATLAATKTDTPTTTPTVTPTFTVTPTQGTPTPTAGDSCGLVCSVGQGCRRQVGGQILPGECVPTQNCQCVVGGTATPMPSSTPSLSPPVPSLTPTKPAATVTPTVTPTTAAGNGGGGGGGGCGCRIDPNTGQVADSVPWPALALPALAWFWRRRRS